MGETEPIMPDAARRARPLLRSAIGEVLRRTRLEQGRTLADVARAARVSLPYLSELERGRKEASSEVLAAICDALRIELPGLLAAAGRELAARRPRRKLAEVDRRTFPPQARGSSDAPQARGSSDVMCLLAA